MAADKIPKITIVRLRSYLPGGLILKKMLPDADEGRRARPLSGDVPAARRDAYDRKRSSMDDHEKVRTAELSRLF